MKKLISFILAVMMLIPLCSCSSETDIKASDEKETLLSGKLDNGGRWFYAETGYLGSVMPIEGTYERTQTSSIYINDTLTDGTKYDSFSPGTIIKIEYDGELHIPSGFERPIISNVYSISYGVYPLQSEAGKFTVACTQTNIDSTFSSKIYDGEIDSVIKIESTEELWDTYIQSISEYELIDKDLELVKNKFLDNFSYYSDDFFDNNVLLFVIVFGGSGGDRFKVDSITVDGNTLSVNFIQTDSGQTCEGSEWMFLVSVDRKTAAKIKKYTKVVN